MKERFLPIGTVVLLENGTKELMITRYCIIPGDTEIKDGEEVETERKLYEYGGCTYPEGILDNDIVYAFNHNQIKKICHMGYETDTQKEFSEALNQDYDEYKLEFEQESGSLSSSVGGPKTM